MTWSLPLLARTYEAAIRDLSEKKPAVRAAALRELSPYLHDRADVIVKAAERALSDESALVRREASTLLGVAGAASSIPELVARVASDDDALVRQFALEALGAIDDERARAAVRRALTDEREEVRFQAVLAVLHFPDEDEAAEALDRAMSDRDPNIRYVAVRTTEERAFVGRAEVRAAVRARLDDESAEVRVAAALFFAETEPELARPIVRDVVRGTLRTKELDDRAHVLELALDVLGEEARQVLEKRAFGFSIFIGGDTIPALVGLARHGDLRAKQRLLAGLDATSLERRVPYVLAAGRAKLTEARARIEAMRDLPEGLLAEVLEELDR